MSTVLIWFVVIVGIVGILLFWSLANTAGWAITVKMADMDCWYQIYGNIPDSTVENAWKSRLMTNG